MRPRRAHARGWLLALFKERLETLSGLRLKGCAPSAQREGCGQPARGER